LEALHWLTEEVSSLKGEAAFTKVDRIETMGDQDIVALFQAQRDNDYAPIAAALDALEVRLSSLEQQSDPKGLERFKGDLQKLLKDNRTVKAIDFFPSPQGAGLQQRLERCEGRLKKLIVQPHEERRKLPSPKRKEEYQDKVWVTRKNPFVDRMASAWLIRRFIDPRARFEFLEEEHAIGPVPEEVSFDVPGGDFSHEQDRCTFEVLLEAFALRGKALRKVSEVVHELDLKDGKFHNPQASGVESILLGIRKTTADDGEALEEGIAVFDRLYAALSK
jgi:hypothetical protein